jgi:structural maintenance of chromosome 2
VGDKAHLALTLIGYDKDISAAMAYVFGDTLICADAATAKAVTFDPKIAMKSVTLDGDVYDPSGTLSGGAAPTSSGLLKKVKELNDVEIELNAAKTQLAKLEKEDAKLQAVKTKWKDSKRAVEIKEHEITLLKEQVESSNAVRVSLLQLRIRWLEMLIFLERSERPSRS